MGKYHHRSSPTNKQPLFLSIINHTSSARSAYVHILHPGLPSLVAVLLQAVDRRDVVTVSQAEDHARLAAWLVHQVGARAAAGSCRFRKLHLGNP